MWARLRYIIYLFKARALSNSRGQKKKKKKFYCNEKTRAAETLNRHEATFYVIDAKALLQFFVVSDVYLNMRRLLSWNFYPERKCYICALKCLREISLVSLCTIHDNVIREIIRSFFMVYTYYGFLSRNRLLWNHVFCVSICVSLSLRNIRGLWQN